jgi:hypothetical protein
MAPDLSPQQLTESFLSNFGGGALSTVTEISDILMPQLSLA